MLRLQNTSSNNMGIGIAGSFKAQDYIDAGYTGVGLASFNGSIPKNKKVIGQYTKPLHLGGKGGGGAQYFVIADDPGQQAAPAPTPAPDAPSPEQQLQIAQLTEQSEAYRKQSEEQLAAANATIANLSNEELQRQRAAELQNRLAIQAASSQARGMAAPSLKIASATPQTAGTQAFKRRRDQVTMAPIQSTAGINVPTGSVLNI